MYMDLKIAAGHALTNTGRVLSMVGTGAPRTFISDKVAGRLKIKYDHGTRQFKVMNHEPVRIKGTTKVMIYIEEWSS